MHHAFKIGDHEHSVELSRARSGYRLHIADRSIAVDLAAGVGGHARLTVNGETCEVFIATRGDEVFVHLDGEVYQLSYEHPLERLAHQAHGAADDEIRAPMPGSLVNIAAKPGQTVAKGDLVLVMESMKMETSIAAPRDGVVAAIHFEKGQPFERDALLLTLEPFSHPLPRVAGEGEGGGAAASTPPSQPSPASGGRRNAP